jgi:probable F420-dependent oxidoreductase
VVTPVIGVMPSYRTPAVADPDYVAGFARAVEESGGESIWAVEHVAVPSDYASRYPYAADGRMPLSGDEPIPDPLDWLAFVAAHTSRVKLATAVVILPEHHPVDLAKRLATIDVLSKGRMLLGIGVGWLREEAEALGTSFGDRGARADEYIEVMRTLWSNKVATWHGRTVNFDDLKSEPKPLHAGGVPIVVGGHSRAAARRAGRLGDGFFPLGVGTPDLPALLADMAAAAGAAGRDPETIELTTHGTRDLDEARRLVDLGVRRFVLSVRADPDIEQVRRLIGDFTDRVLAKLS